MVGQLQWIITSLNRIDLVRIVEIVLQPVRDDYYNWSLNQITDLKHMKLSQD